MHSSYSTAKRSSIVLQIHFMLVDENLVMKQRDGGDVSSLLWPVTSTRLILRSPTTSPTDKMYLLLMEGEKFRYRKSIEDPSDMRRAYLLLYHTYSLSKETSNQQEANWTNSLDKSIAEQ